MAAEDEYSDLLSAYALGTLDEDETTQLETHLATCASCQSSLRAYQEVVGYLPLAVADAEPSPALKGRLLASVKTMDGETTVSLSTPSPRLNLRSWLRHLYRQPVTRRAILVIMALLIVVNVLLWQQVSQLRAPEQSTGMVALAMTSTNEAEDASGFFLVSEDGLSGAIVADELPQLDADLHYQLWLFRGQDVIDKGGSFTVDELGYGGKWVSAPESLHTYTHFSVTIEPVDSDADQPTGVTVLTGVFP